MSLFILALATVSRDYYTTIAGFALQRAGTKPSRLPLIHIVLAQHANVSSMTPFYPVYVLPFPLYSLSGFSPPISRHGVPQSALACHYISISAWRRP